MKIRVGDRDVSSQNMVREVERNILARVARNTDLRASRNNLRHLADQVNFVANNEVDKILDIVREVFTHNSGGLADVAGLLKLYVAPRRGIEDKLVSVPKVTWAPLTFKYAKWKHDLQFGRSTRRSFTQRNTILHNAPTFFVLRGGLKGYFNRYGHDLLHRRMGGVTVNLDLSGLEQGGDRILKVFETGGDNGDQKSVIGRLSVNIFPGVSSALLPALTANTWTAGTTAHLEASLFEDRKVLYKLTNPKGTYRPLFLPILQFFILSRIPARVRAVVNEFIQNREVS